MDADGSNRRFLVSGPSPRFSPDGKTILYTEENTHPGKLWKMVGVDGSNLRDLGKVEDSVFSTDGRHVLCLSPEWRRRLALGAGHLWIESEATGCPRRLRGFPPELPRWVPLQGRNE